MQDRERLRVVNKSTIEEKLQQGNSRTNSQRNYDLTREKFEERNGNRREKKVDMENGRDVSGKFSSAPEIEIKINLSSPSKSKSKSKTPSNVAHAHNLYKPAHVPKPEKTNHEKKTNDIRLQNDLKRLELKLRNMTKVNMMSTETRGEATRDKYSHYPQMRPMSANVQAIEKIELDIKLLRRKLRKGGGGEEEEKEREKEEREREKEREKDTKKDTEKDQPARKPMAAWGSESEEKQQPQKREEKKVEDTPPANEREARLRQRVIDRERRLQRVREEKLNSSASASANINNSNSNNNNRITIPATVKTKSQDIYRSEVADNLGFFEERKTTVAAVHDESDDSSTSSSSSNSSSSSSSSSSNNSSLRNNEIRRKLEEKERANREIQREKERKLAKEALIQKAWKETPTSRPQSAVPQPRPQQQQNRPQTSSPKKRDGARMQKSRPVSIHATGAARKTGNHHLYSEDSGDTAQMQMPPNSNSKKITATKMKGNFAQFFDDNNLSGFKDFDKKSNTNTRSKASAVAKKFNPLTMSWE